MLFGYSLALQVHNAPEGFDFDPALGPFALWLNETRGWSMTRGWATAIETNAHGGTPLELFFSLLDEYRARPVPAACQNGAGTTDTRRQPDDEETGVHQESGS